MRRPRGSVAQRPPATGCRRRARASSPSRCSEQRPAPAREHDAFPLHIVGKPAEHPVAGSYARVSVSSRRRKRSVGVCDVRRRHDGGVRARSCRVRRESRAEFRVELSAQEGYDHLVLAARTDDPHSATLLRAGSRPAGPNCRGVDDSGANCSMTRRWSPSPHNTQPWKLRHRRTGGGTPLRPRAPAPGHRRGRPLDDQRRSGSSSRRSSSRRPLAADLAVGYDGRPLDPNSGPDALRHPPPRAIPARRAPRP